MWHLSSRNSSWPRYWRVPPACVVKTRIYPCALISSKKSLNINTKDWASGTRQPFLVESAKRKPTSQIIRGTQLNLLYFSLCSFYLLHVCLNVSRQKKTTTCSESRGKPNCGRGGGPYPPLLTSYHRDIVPKRRPSDPPRYGGKILLYKPLEWARS